MKKIIVSRVLLLIVILMCCTRIIQSAIGTLNSACDKIALNEMKVWFYEHLQVQVFENGSLIVWIESLISNPFLDISDVSRGLFACGLSITKNSNPRLAIRYDLNKISREEADLFAYELCHKWTSIFGGNGKLILREEQSFTSPLTGKTRREVFYVYEIVGSSIDRIIHLFLKYKPRGGFLDLINIKNIKSFSKLLFSIFKDDQGNIRYKLEYQAQFPKYFKHRAGEVYVLDLFNLFNFTGPLKVNEKSFCSTIWIILWKRANFDIIILEARIPPKLRIKKRRLAIEVSNMPPEAFLPGEQINELLIKFKIVERGFKIPPLTSKIVGYMLIAGTVILTALIVAILLKRRIK